MVVPIPNVVIKENKTMAEQKTYLELSETDGVSHKFYEVVVNDTEVTIRYGRIGDQGQTKKTNYATPEKALVEANKKIKEKMKKGYEPAIIGVRQKRVITRRQVNSTASTAKRSPVLWKFASGASAFGIFIDQNHCWVGNQSGQIFCLDHDGQVLNQFKLAEGVKCIVADDVWLYVGCDDGNVYNLNSKVPRLAYEIDENVDIYWLDIYDGVVAVSDANGGLTTVNPDDESQWNRLSQGRSGWMVRSDQNGIYHGHSLGVTMYDREGKVIWYQNTDGAVLFGWQELSTVYAATSNKKIHAFTKKGEIITVYQCDSIVYSCATAENGKYVFAGDNSSSIYCFEQSGTRLWKLATGCGSALSMQFLRDRIYIVTTDGSLACIDASETAIKSAQAGTVPEPINIKAPQIDPNILTNTPLETTTNSSQGIILECFKEGNKLRMRVISPGYNPNWKVQFPKDIREESARYIVAEIRQSTNGNFYRVYGDIKKLI